MVGNSKKYPCRRVSHNIQCTKHTHTTHKVQNQQYLTRLLSEKQNKTGLYTRD